ncbi:hypothetical protein HNP36_002224 [Chryseobacterium shigense]|uniref:Uncharacterized protein n=1 Tax=Chryseobacterium shigense TaxID=297244 RepID=A0A841NBS1_9FLAO|nr:hypothetical protein [Chryseobacterium shigense]
MILNNKKVINVYIWTLTTAVIGSFLLFLFIIFFTFNVQKEWVMLWLSGVFTCLGSFILFRIRCFQYEYFKEFMTIRIFHPWEKELIPPSVELPKGYIKDYLIQKKKWGYTLRIMIETGDGRNKSRQYTMFGFKDSQIMLLELSLEDLKKL